MASRQLNGGEWDMSTLFWGHADSMLAASFSETSTDQGTNGVIGVAPPIPKNVTPLISIELPFKI